MRNKRLMAALDESETEFRDLAIVSYLQKRLHMEQHATLCKIKPKPRQKSKHNKLLKKLEQMIRKKSQIHVQSFNILQKLNYLTKVMLGLEEKKVEQKPVQINPEKKELSHSNRMIPSESRMIPSEPQQPQQLPQLSQINIMEEEDPELAEMQRHSNSYMVDDSDQKFIFNNDCLEPEDNSVIQEEPIMNAAEEPIQSHNVPESRPEDKEFYVSLFLSSSVKTRSHRK